MQCADNPLASEMLVLLLGTVEPSLGSDIENWLTAPRRIRSPRRSRVRIWGDNMRLDIYPGTIELGARSWGGPLASHYTRRKPIIRRSQEHSPLPEIARSQLIAGRVIPTDWFSRAVPSTCVDRHATVGDIV
jgi:hypothetical protein